MSIFNMPKKSIWGAVQSAKEIGENVFWVSTASHGGIMIPTHVASEIISAKAIAMGVEQHGYFQYEEDGLKDIPLYELIKNNHITDNEVLENYDLKDIKLHGHWMYPEYFGEFEKPETSIWGDVLSCTNIMNGVGAVKSEENVGLAVHKVVACYQLSTELENKGKISGNYIFFDKEYVNPVIEQLKRSSIDEMKYDRAAYKMLGIYGAYLVESEEEHQNDFVADDDEDELEL